MVKKGKCGEVNYTIDGDTLTFSGKGYLAQHSGCPQAAWTNNPDIKKIEVAEGSEISAPLRFEGFFHDMKGLEDISGLAKIDTSDVRSMYRLFSHCENLKDFSPIAGWDVSGVNSLYATFEDTKLDDLKTFEKWDMSNVYNLTDTFKDCTELRSLEGAENFDLSNCNCFSYTFAYTQISDLTPLKEWTPASPAAYQRMFYGCEHLENADALKNWDMTPDDRDRVFEGTNIDPGYTINGKCGDIDYTIKDGVLTFSGMGALEEYSIEEDVPWHDYKIEKVAVEPGSDISATDLSYYFTGQDKLTDISGLAEINTEDLGSINSMFIDCEKLEDISPLKDWNVEQVNDMSSAFAGCHSLKDLTPLKNWEPEHLVCADYMLSACKMETLDGLQDFCRNGWLESIDGMFSGCVNLEDISAVKDWYVLSADSMEYMFAGDNYLLDISPLKGWELSENTNLNGMFKDCNDLRDADALLDWELTDWGQVESMFEGTKVEELPIYEEEYEIDDECL